MTPLFHQSPRRKEPVPSAPATMPATGCGPVQDIVRRLDEAMQGAQRVTPGDVMAAFGHRSFLPTMMVPALLMISPLSGIPLFSSVCGLTIALMAGQMLWPGRNWLWLPPRPSCRAAPAGGVLFPGRGDEPMFEIVPMASSVLGLAVLLMATALLTRDGLFALGGIVVLALAPLMILGNVVAVL